MRRHRVGQVNVLVFEVTDCQTRWAHLVTEAAAAAGRHRGCYRAVCGNEVLAASLTTPEQGLCQLCAQWQAGR